MKEYFVYFVTNWTNEVLYIGVTGNLETRIAQHKQRIYDGYTKRYICDRLVYFETYQDINIAIAREKQLKGWRCDKKDKLVQALNSDWEDLSKGWYKDPSTALGMTGENY